MIIITKNQAKLEGLLYFYTGEACKNGHLAQRKTKTGNCVECTKEYREKNKEKARDAIKTYRIENKDKIKETRKAYNLAHRESNKEYREKNKIHRAELKKSYKKINKEHIKEKDRIYRQKNREKINAYARKYHNNLLRTDSTYRLKCNIHSLICTSFKRNGFSKKGNTEKILGCTYEEFIKHIEKQFLKGMTWENKSLWHIDHVVPISSANTESEVIELNHFTNLRPLWAEENRHKSAKMEYLL